MKSGNDHVQFGVREQHDHAAEPYNYPPRCLTCDSCKFPDAQRQYNSKRRNADERVDNATSPVIHEEEQWGLWWTALLNCAGNVGHEATFHFSWLRGLGIGIVYPQ